MPNKGTANCVENGGGSTKYFQRRYFTLFMYIPADNAREKNYIQRELGKGFRLDAR